jgi:hypothetical protein
LILRYSQGFLRKNHPKIIGGTTNIERDWVICRNFRTGTLVGSDISNNCIHWLSGTLKIKIPAIIDNSVTASTLIRVINASNSNCMNGWRELRYRFSMISKTTKKVQAGRDGKPYPGRP